MQILQAKVRCLKGVVDSGWFKPGHNATLLFGEKRETVSQILKGLEALNPLYDIVLVDPLGDSPQTWQQGKYQRHVIKEKKTAVYAVFSSEPELVKTLVLLDESLIETDRIELGRRLDYSRWISFVELSASARWSDIAGAMHALRTQRTGNEGFHNRADETFFTVCNQTDRIKGELARKCREWLLANTSNWTGDSAPLYKKCLQEVNLHERFKLAGKLVEEYLPPIIRLQPETALKEKYSLGEVLAATGGNDPVAALLKQLCRRFDLTSLSEENLERLRERISDVSSMRPLSQFSILLTIDDSGFALDGLKAWTDSRLNKRMILIWFVGLLTQLLWQRFPFFLLDRYDKDLSDKERLELADSLIECGKYTQIFLSPDRVENRQDYVFTTVLCVTSEGQVEEELGNSV